MSFQKTLGSLHYTGFLCMLYGTRHISSAILPFDEMHRVVLPKNLYFAEMDYYHIVGKQYLGNSKFMIELAAIQLAGY
jgi:hypothetical protein